MTTQPTTLDLDAIEARAEAATPGPWAIETLQGPSLIQMRVASLECSDDDRHIGPTGAWHGRMPSERDAAFIAAARTDVPALVSEVKRLRAALEQIAERPEEPHSPMFSIGGCAHCIAKATLDYPPRVSRRGEAHDDRDDQQQYAG